MTRHSSCREGLFWGLKDDSTSQRSIASSVKRRREPRRGDPADHCAIAQDRQVEGGPIERDQLRGEIGDSADERGDDLLLRALADIRGAESQDRPVFILSLGDQSADAGDRMIDELGELIPHLRAHFVVGPSRQCIGGREAAQVGHGLDILDPRYPRQ